MNELLLSPGCTLAVMTTIFLFKFFGKSCPINSLGIILCILLELTLVVTVIKGSSMPDNALHKIPSL